MNVCLEKYTTDTPSLTIGAGKIIMPMLTSGRYYLNITYGFFKHVVCSPKGVIPPPAVICDFPRSATLPHFSGKRSETFSIRLAIFFYYYYAESLLSNHPEVDYEIRLD